MVNFNEEKQNKRFTELRQKEEEDLAQMLSSKYGVDYLDLTRVSINTNALRLIPEATAREVEAAIINQIGKKLTVAVRSPNKQEVTDMIGNLKDRGYTTSIVMVSMKSLERAWDMYKDISFATETRAGGIDMSGEELRSLLDDVHNIDDVRHVIEDVLHLKKSHRTSRILEVILSGAMLIGSSDIHFEPEEEKVRLRYRLDGVLTDIVNFDLDTYKLVLSRIKLISGLKLNLKTIAQDGRFSISIDNTDTEVRTSVIPDAYGESIVMRLLDPRNIQVELNELGINDHLLKILREEISKPNGMLLTTGPTGSGKTTTLYSILKEIHTPDVKILTIEDPVEYHLAGIVQTQTSDKYSFQEGLRAALRQDPDVIMVGEIRDREVAETAVHAALTGHLVFSTLHTNNAAGSFARLIDLGVNSKVLGSAITVSMAQRLVRKLCVECKKEVPISDKYKKIVGDVIDSIVLEENRPKKSDTMWEPVGCSKCNNIGYKGRVGLYEAILMDEEIENLVTRNPSEREVMATASKQGIMSMRQDGVSKALHGITSFEELERVITLHGRESSVEKEEDVDIHDKEIEV